MNPAKLLLIEDNPSDATLFCDRIQNELGSEIEIEWKTRLTDAMAWLEAGNRPDQIWLDPGLPDLGQQNLGKALSTLKKYVAAGELKLLSSTVAPSVARAAEQQQVQVLNKDATNTQVLQIVQELLTKRSGGTTARVEAAKLEGKIAKIEYQVGSTLERLARIEAALERLATVAFEVNATREALNRIPPLEAKFKEFQQQLEAKIREFQQFREGSQQVRLKRMDMLQAIFIALISGGVALGTLALPKLLPDQPTPLPLEPNRPGTPDG